MAKVNAVTAIRQNHAMEHATISLLIQRFGVNTRIAGRATAGCFYLYGNLPTEAVKEATCEALARLKKGEKELALSPFCGTNIAVTGAMSGIASLLALGSRNRVLNLPRVLAAAIIAAVAAQPMGRLMQKHFTTTPQITSLEIDRITKSGRGPLTIHKVETTRG